MFKGHETRVSIVERDIYARQAMVSYLCWDRRTRVVGQAGTVHEMLADLRDDPGIGRLDSVVLDTSLAATSDGLAALVNLILHHCPGVGVVCLAHSASPDMALAAAQAGARAYYTREQVGIGLVSAITCALWQRFVITRDVLQALDRAGRLLSVPFTLLPERRSFPRLTERIEEALMLCVIEGLPAERAAEEMGVSTSTIRSYIKEGYRILEACAETVFPPDMSPAERAFLRYTALELPPSYQAQDEWEHVAA